ncbi:hypothetical protein Taro_008184, partial [Colocasia esculenta]|nr:hypothetical protein [Colocasia esculenta]
MEGWQGGKCRKGNSQVGIFHTERATPNAKSREKNPPCQQVGDSNFNCPPTRLTQFGSTWARPVDRGFPLITMNWLHEALAEESGPNGCRAPIGSETGPNDLLDFCIPSCIRLLGPYLSRLNSPASLRSSDSCPKGGVNQVIPVADIEVRPMP